MGHLAVLEWLIPNGCPWDKHTRYFAARYGHPAVLQWLRAHGCSEDESDEESEA
jgi:hypothetical protein